MIAQPVVESLHQQLAHRRTALASAISEIGPATDLVRLLGDVNRALEQLGTDAFGRCIVCDGRMDDAEMVEIPTRQYCLCRQSPAQQEALQRDLDMAWRVQASLLPDQDKSFAGWQIHYRYRPAGPVSGDYCDVITHESAGGWMYFFVGDVSGKGVAASYIMAHLSALVRSTLVQPVPVSTLMDSLNRYLLDRATGEHFVTLLAGRANREGLVEMCNAGHCLPIVVGSEALYPFTPSALPLGIVPQLEYQSMVTRLAIGDSLVLHTDGISEARNPLDEFYGVQRLAEFAGVRSRLSSAQLAAACLDDLQNFQAGMSQSDDMTLMIVRRMSDE